MKRILVGENRKVGEPEKTLDKVRVYPLKSPLCRHCYTYSRPQPVGICSNERKNNYNPNFDATVLSFHISSIFINAIATT